MRNIFLIARREYLERVRTKSFLIMTIMIPAFMLGVTVLPSLFMMKMSGGSKHYMVVAPEKSTAEMIRQQLAQLSEDEKKQPSGPQALERRSQPRMGHLTVDMETDTSDAARARLAERVKQKELDGVIFATREGLASRKILFMTRDVSSLIANEQVRSSINQALRRDFMKSKGFTDQDAENALQSVELDAQDPTGTHAGNPLVTFFTVFAMVMILYMTVLLYGINVMRAILEEKTSRIMEVMLSIAQAKEMLAGKIAGVAAVGLTQIAIWAIMAGVPLSLQLIAGADAVKSVLSVKLLLYFPLFFLLGFVLYSTLCAAVGAMVNSEQEAQQLQFVVMLPMVASIIIMVNVIQNPGSPMAFWASLFPLTAPLMMFLRVALQSPPAWQVILSIGLMIATIYGLILLCERIYRVGILMYGKKPTLPEIMKWIRYA